jgi:outer membrane protein
LTKIRIAAPEIDSPIFGLQSDALYRQALEYSPDIMLAESNLKAKEFHIEAGKGDKLPRIDIVSQYALFSKTNNYADYFNRFSRNNYIIGLSMQMPIWDGSRTASKTAQNREEANEARLKLEQSKSRLKMGIERGYSAYRVAFKVAEAAQKDVEVATEMVKVSETLYESGKIGAKDLEETRSLLQQKEMSLVETNRALFERKLDLLSVSGAIASLLQ